jgi:hypothetical protein
MKTRLLFLIALGLLLLLMTVVVLAANGYTLDWWTVDSGGGDSHGGTYVLSGAIGQPDAARSQDGSYTLSGGFWSGGGLQMYLLHLPVVLKP